MSFVVSSLSQVFKNFSHDHWFSAMKVLSCLKRTSDLGLDFMHSECLKLVGFCDSDWGGDPNDRQAFHDSQDCVYFLSLVKILDVDLDGPVFLQSDN